MYLLIQNKGVAPIEGYTLLGMSTSRGNSDAIGQFGSGTKHAINYLLRRGIEFHIYCGKTRLEFYYEFKNVNDGLRDTEVARVYCKLTGESNRTIECGWVLDFGALDWTETSMALREFVSNAIDRTVKGGDNFRTANMAGDLFVGPEPTRRAKDGYTRIFVALHGSGVQEFYNELGHHFLHFSNNPQHVGLRHIPTPTDNQGPKIYRQGVFVRQLTGKPAAFNYNFKPSELDIDESRNSSDYSVRAAIAQAINIADESTLVSLFDRMSKGEVYESNLDTYYLGYRDSEEQKAKWQSAWNKVAGDAVIATDRTTPIVEAAVRKGHTVKQIASTAFVEVAAKMGVRTAVSTLGDAGAKGAEVLDHESAEFNNAAFRVWHWLTQTGMTNGKECPQVKLFRSLTNAEGDMMGYFTPGGNTIFIREDLGGKYLLKTILEEMTHYITGSTDNSRDFQNFLIDMVVQLCHEDYSYLAAQPAAVLGA